MSPINPHNRGASTADAEAEEHDLGRSLVRFSDEDVVREMHLSATDMDMSDTTDVVPQEPLPLVEECPRSAIRKSSFQPPSVSHSRRVRTSIFQRMGTEDWKSFYNKENSRHTIPTITLFQAVMNTLIFIGNLCASRVDSSTEPNFSFGGMLIWTTWIYVPSLFVSFATVEAFAELLFGYKKKMKYRGIVKVVAQLLICCIISFFGIYIAFSPCFSCARQYTNGNMVSDGAELIFGDAHGTGTERNLGGLWQVIFEPEPGVEVDPSTTVCRACASWLVYTFALGCKEGDCDKPESTATSSVDDLNKTIESRHDLIRWYHDFREIESKKYFASSWNRVLESVAKDGEFNNEDLHCVLDDLLCSPASRIDAPDPSQFLTALDRPQYTGEDIGGQGLDIPLEKLQAIMRGDMIRNLGPSICFLLRIPLLLAEDMSSERFPVSSILDATSLMSQHDMNAEDVAFSVPGLVLSQVDPDIDPESKKIETVKSALGLYTRLPFEDKQYYFDTKEEYLAFYRWTLANSMQGEWYLPEWLRFLGDDDNNDYASLLYERQLFSPELTSFVNPTSDETLADRTFYGTGQKFLTSLKLPGDTDYHYIHPANPDYYISKKHSEFYRYINKPTNEDLLRMAKSFWSDELAECDASNSSNSTENECLLSLSGTDSLLEEMKSRIVEVDFAHLAMVPGRGDGNSATDFSPSGAILYLDTESRMPMGIFKTNKTDGEDIGAMYLPTDGRDWEHAKFNFRTAERAALAFIHIIESHLGWSHAVSVATLQTVPSNHKLYALLKPFTINVHVVNSAAYHMLVREHGVLEHASGLKSVADALNFFGHHTDFAETVPEMLESKQLDAAVTKDLPLFSQGQRLWAVHYEFVSDYVTKILYDSDEAMMADDSIHRFWHHVNTFGRGHDPCVCDMDTDSFFQEGVWPAFDSSSDSTRTCNALLDSAKFLPESATPNNRRREWCLQDDITRLAALRNMLDEQCNGDSQCNHLRHSFEHMRLNMGLKPLKTRDQLIDFLTSAIWHVTVGHRINGDNVAYLSDPSMVAVRQRVEDNNGELPLIADVGTYVSGLAIGALTTVRTNALLADWSPIYKYMSDVQYHLSKEERSDLFNITNNIHQRYKSKLLKLSRVFLRESASRPKNQRTNVFNPASQSASVSV